MGLHIAATYYIKKTMGVLKLLYIALLDTIAHDGIEHAGYLSFLLMLAIFPFLVFFVAIVGSIGLAIDNALVNTLTELIVESSWANFINALKPRIIEITSLPPQNFLTIAIASAVWTASSIFEAIRTILNRAYRVQVQPSYIWRRLFSIIEFMAVIVITAVVMFVLVILPSIWEVVSEYISYTGISTPILLDQGAKDLRYITLITFSILLISYLYYALPSRKQRVLQTLPGTITVLLGWMVFSIVFKYYIFSFSQLNLIYGSIAGVIIALLYFYVCSLIFIYGAELNYHLEQWAKDKNANHTNCTKKNSNTRKY